MPRLATTARPLPLAAAALLLAACGSDPATGPVEPPPPPQPEPATTRLQLDFSYVEVIKDCDGVEGDGEFRFRVSAEPSVGGARTMLNTSPRLGDGDRTSAIGRRTFTLPATAGQQVVVRFRASEVDTNIIGQSFNDDRMNNVERTASHRFNGSSWSATGPRSITLGSGNCQVRLRYTVDPV